MAYYEGAYFEGALYEGIEAGESVARSAESSVDGLIRASIAASASIDALIGDAPFWYDTDWGRREKFQVNSDYIDEDLEDFRVCIKTGDCFASSGDFWDKVASDGADIVVTTDDGITRCPVDLFSIDTVAETIELYFLAPEISSSANTVFYLYYDNPSASAPAASDPYGSQAVWDSDLYKGVYHFSDSAPQIADSTANGNDGTSGHEDINASGGLLGSGSQFNGPPDQNGIVWDDYADFDFDSDSFLVQVLMRDRDSDPATQDNHYLQKGNAGGTGYGWSLTVAGSLAAALFDPSYPSPAKGVSVARSIGTWRRVEFGVDRSGTDTLFLRVNGTVVASRTDITSSIGASSKCLVGGKTVGNTNCGTGSGGWATGDLDEVRILRGTVLSDAHAAAEASNFLESDFIQCAITQSYPSETATIDAIIVGQYQFATIDALIQLQDSKQASIDAAVQASLSVNASIDAVIRDLCGVYPRVTAASNAWEDVPEAANAWAQKAAADNEWVGVDPVCED